MQSLLEKFSKPENWNKCAEGTGYVMYCGGNDWQNSSTAVWVVFPSDEANRRMWFTIKFPDGCIPDSGDSGGSKDENRDRCRKHAEKAWHAWIRVAKEAHKNRNHGSRSWKDAFKTALYSKEMQPYVEEHGEEQTKWDEVKEGARQIVNKLLEGGLDEPERYVNQAGFRTFNLTFDFGCGETGYAIDEVKVPRHLLVGMNYEQLREAVTAYAMAHVKDVPQDDWDWLVGVDEINPVDFNPDEYERLGEAADDPLDDVSPEVYLDRASQKLGDEQPCLVSPVHPGDWATAPCRVVLLHSLNYRPEHEEWVTRLENMQVGGQFSGHYIDGYPLALQDYKERCEKLGVDWRLSEPLKDA
jgi:hypothetical protein